MEKAGDDLSRLYGNKVRVRACGICIQNDKILLAGHRMSGMSGLFWSPPGGGIQFGENAVEALKREFLEETGLSVEAGELLFLNEFIVPPLHALELFFRIRSFTGDLSLGMDPEFSVDSQILRQIKFMSFEEVKALPSDSVHSFFSRINSLQEIFEIRGFL